MCFGPRRPLRRVTALLAALLLFAPPAESQSTSKMPPADVQAIVQGLKTDPRGPFQGIRWFCPDGSVLPPTSRCPEPGGSQHGLLKPEIERLRATNHLFLGQVLAGTDFAEFLDEPNGFSRLKQYQIEQYLVRTDDGWIFRRARFYRGAFQAEDEDAWGRRFLEWMLQRRDLVTGRFYLAHEAVRDVPHGEGNDLVQRIRATSKEISDAYPPFLDIRVKIHGQPEARDTLRVASFRKANADRMPPELVSKLEALSRDMRAQYGGDPLSRVSALARRLSGDSETRRLVESLSGTRSPSALLATLGSAAVAARREIERADSGRLRLRLMDVSLEIEALAFRSAAAWHPDTPGALISKFDALAQVALGTGLLEWWEAGEIEWPRSADAIPFDTFETAAENAQRIVEWGTGMVYACFQDEISRYQAFEPAAAGFLDDRMRSTVLLAMGETAGDLVAEAGLRSGRVSRMMGLAGRAGIRGLNPGMTVGELIVKAGVPDDIDFKPDAIYLLERAPPDLKPVAGIATVSEGNLVSHVQLLARNLGIPNAVISPEVLHDLAAYSGRRVFYAVSPRGSVLMKPASEMTAEERGLIEQRKRSEERIQVPTTRMDLAMTRLESLRELRAGDSGRVCGPKAANLGQLTTLFPDNVAPGFIIPFGVFREHMDQAIPGRGGTYWQKLESVFEAAQRARAEGAPAGEIDRIVLTGLAELRDAIERMPLKPSFVDGLRRRFAEVLGRPLGEAPVFVRSDTNMEDLKDFTGAGLNLTIPNVVSEADVLQAIRRVWASPYRERSYRWRQKYLLNPQDVYPSLLILSSVNADKSGVMITTGVSSGIPGNYTVAFNRGVGGAVDGQAAETYELMPGGGHRLLAPAREPEANTLPPTGGVKPVTVTFADRILTNRDLDALLQVGSRIRQSLPGTPGIETGGPFDVELGLLNDHVWLFQARPFVENRSAAQSAYLSRLDLREATLPEVKMTEKLRSR